MKKSNKLLAALAAIFFTVSPAQSQQSLSSNQLDACGAILCLAGLAAGVNPAACARPLAAYFGISVDKPWKLLTARLNFLNMCPNTNYSYNSILVNGAGQCTPETLNYRHYINVYTDGGGDAGGNTVLTDIPTELPKHCSDFYALGGKSSKPPRFAGDHWVNFDEYDAAMVVYLEKIKQREAELERCKKFYFLQNCSNQSLPDH
jgi:hypothetical protein